MNSTTVHANEHKRSFVEQNSASDHPDSPNGIDVPSLTRGRSIFNSQASSLADGNFVNSPLSPEIGTIKMSASVSSSLDEQAVSSDDEDFSDNPLQTDVLLVNEIIDKYSAKLLAFSNQFWKGDEEWQILAYKLQQTILKLKIDINNIFLTQELRLNAIHDLIAEFNQAISQRVGDDLNKLQERNLVTRLLGANKLSIKSILLEFKQDEHRLQYMLMKYEEKYIDYELQPDLFEAKQYIANVSHKNPDSLAIENFLLNLNYRSINPDDTNDNQFQYKKYNVLYERLLADYPGQPAYAAFAQEAEKLYNYFLLVPSALTGSWRVTVAEILRLYQMSAPIKLNRSPEQRLSARINDKLLRASHALNLDPLIVSVSSIPVTVRKSALAHFSKPGIPMVAALSYPPSSIEGLFNEINNHILAMYDVVRRLAVSPTAPSLLIKHSYPLMRELYLKTITKEHSYIPLTQGPQTTVQNEISRERIAQHLLRARLIAIYEFCFYYKNLDVGPGLHDKRIKKIGDFTQLTESLAKKLGAKIDPNDEAYNKFLNNREFEVISRVANLQRPKLKEFREQFWLGDEKWQKIARGLEIELDKLQKIVDDKHARLLQRLAAATEIYDVFDRAIQIRVGYKLNLLKEHTIVTEALQFFDLGYCFSKISLKDILADYREDKKDGKGAVVETSGMHLIETSLKNIIRRLPVEDHRNFIYQRNFRYIYYTLSLYITYLHQYVMLKPRPANELLTVARKLLATVGNSARKIRYVHLPTSDPKLCLDEAKAVLKDFDLGILSLLQAKYSIILAPHLQHAETISVPEVRNTIVAAIHQAQEELMNRKKFRFLTEEIRMLLLHIEQPPVRAEKFIKSILDKIYTNQSYARLRSKLPELPDTELSGEPSALKAGHEFLYHLRIIINSLKPHDTVEGLLELIKPWQAECFKDVSNNNLSNQLTELIKADLITALRRFHNRMDAAEKIEEAFLKFPLTLTVAQLQEVVETNLILHIENPTSRVQASDTFEMAMINYTKHDPEGDLIQKFLLDSLQEERTVSELEGILLDFKRNAEKVILSWIQEIEKEMQACLELSEGTSLLRQTSEVSSLNSVIFPHLNGRTLPLQAPLTPIRSAVPGSGDVHGDEQEHKSLNGARRSPPQRGNSPVVPVLHANGHAPAQYVNSQQFFLPAPARAGIVVVESNHERRLGLNG